MTITPNQSYLVKQMEWHIAAAICQIMRDEGANVKAAWESFTKDPNRCLWWPSAWRKDNQHFKCRLQWGKPGMHSCYIGFSNARWDSQHSDLKYGTKSIDKAVNEREDGKTKIIYNKTDGPIHVAYEESVELTNSFSSSITKGVTLDMGMDASVDTSVTVGAEYAGVSAETSVSAHFGISKSKSESTEQGKEESEEGTKSESLAIDFDAAPGRYYLVEVTKKNERTSQPFDINGVMDFDLNLTYYKGSPEHQWHRDFKGVDAYEQYLHGYDTGHPEMAGWLDKAEPVAKSALAYIMNPENRRIQVSGISHASLDSNADYSVEELGDHVPEALDHLPVISATDA